MTRYALVVRELVTEADRRAADSIGQRLNKGAALAQLLEQSGYIYQAAAVRSWIRGNSKPPADVLLAAVTLAGMSIDQKLELAREPTDIEERVDQLTEQLVELRQQVSAIASSTPALAPEAPVLLPDVRVRITNLEREIRDAAPAFGRSWEPPASISDSAPDQLEHELKRRVGVLQARIMEIRSLVGLPQKEAPVEPDPVDKDAVLSWLAKVVAGLQVQMDELHRHPQYQQRVEGHVAPAEGRRRAE